MPDTDTSDTLQTMLTTAKSVKESADFGDVIPICIVETDTDGVIVGFPDIDLLPAALHAVSQSVPGTPQRIGLVVDTYMLNYKLADESENIARKVKDLYKGSLAAAWERGDREGITEALMITTYDGESLIGLCQPYDADVKTWGDPVEPKGFSFEGRVPDMLYTGWLDLMSPSEVVDPDEMPGGHDA